MTTIAGLIRGVAGTTLSGVIESDPESQVHRADYGGRSWSWTSMWGKYGQRMGAVIGVIIALSGVAFKYWGMPILPIGSICIGIGITLALAFIINERVISTLLFATRIEETADRIEEDVDRLDRGVDTLQEQNVLFRDQVGSLKTQVLNLKQEIVLFMQERADYSEVIEGNLRNGAQQIEIQGQLNEDLAETSRNISSRAAEQVAELSQEIKELKVIEERLVQTNESLSEGAQRIHLAVSDLDTALDLLRMYTQIMNLVIDVRTQYLNSTQVDKNNNVIILKQRLQALLVNLTGIINVL
jgi:methyl-accepting chemotaxis protein